MSDTARPTPAQELHGAAMRLKQELDVGMEAKMSPLHDVGARPAVPIVREEPFTLPADNGSNIDIAKP